VLWKYERWTLAFLVVTKTFRRAVEIEVDFGVSCLNKNFPTCCGDMRGGLWLFLSEQELSDVLWRYERWTLAFLVVTRTFRRAVEI
jgi:hypothetical protein